MDTYMEALRRAGINDPDAARKYENAINRLIAIGHAETLHTYHNNRMGETSRDIHNADTIPWSQIHPVAPTSDSTITENHLRVLEDEYSWEFDELDEQMALARIRFNEEGFGAGCIGWWPNGLSCQEYKVNPQAYCSLCVATRSHKMSVVRLILMRRRNDITFVSFDDTNEEHMAAVARNRVEEEQDYGQLVELWSEKLGKQVIRDTNVNDWNPNWTVEYHDCEWWYELRIELMDERDWGW